MRWFRRRNHAAPWEVVGCETIAPVLMFDSEVDSQDEGVCVPNRSRTLPATDQHVRTRFCICRRGGHVWKIHIRVHEPYPKRDSLCQCCAVRKAAASPAGQEKGVQRSAPGRVSSFRVYRLQGPNFLSRWTLTLLRQGRRHRIQVDYTGRPGCVSGKLPPLRPPPFMALLEGQHIFQ